MVRFSKKQSCRSCGRIVKNLHGLDMVCSRCHKKRIIKEREEREKDDMLDEEFDNIEEDYL